MISPVLWKFCIDASPPWTTSIDNSSTPSTSDDIAHPGLATAQKWANLVAPKKVRSAPRLTETEVALTEIQFGLRQAYQLWDQGKSIMKGKCATRFRAHMRKYPHGPNKDKKIQCSRLCMKLSTTPKLRFLLLNISYEFLTSKKYVDSYLIYLETGDNMPAVPKLKQRRLSNNSSKARATTMTVRNSIIIAPPNMNPTVRGPFNW